MLIVAITATVFTSCGNQYATINGGGGGGRQVSHTEKVRIRAPRTQVFPNQNPPPANAEHSTWGRTTNTEYWWNAINDDEAERQPVSPNEPVLVRRDGDGNVMQTWRPDCYNQVAGARSPAVTYETVGGGGGGNSIVQYGATFNTSINMPISVYGGGGFAPQQQRCRPQQGFGRQMRPPQRPQYRPQPPPRPRCLIYDRCGRIVGYRWE